MFRRHTRSRDHIGAEANARNESAAEAAQGRDDRPPKTKGSGPSYSVPTQLIILALVAGVVNGLVKPIVRLLSLPVRMATLGLFSFVINAGLLLLIAWLSGQFDIPFSIAGFPPEFSFDALGWALIGSVVLSIINTIVGNFIHD